MPMEIPEKVLKFRYHIFAALVFSATIVSLIVVAPRFITLFSYFWPLLLSTALVLALVFFFAKTSPLPAIDDASLDSTLLDYVAGGHSSDPHFEFDTHHSNKLD